jgi:hypothetical protein
MSNFGTDVLLDMSYKLASVYRCVVLPRTVRVHQMVLCAQVAGKSSSSTTTAWPHQKAAPNRERQLRRRSWKMLQIMNMCVPGIMDGSLRLRTDDIWWYTYIGGRTWHLGMIPNSPLWFVLSASSVAPWSPSCACGANKDGFCILLPDLYITTYKVWWYFI